MAWPSDVTQRVVEVLGDPRLLIALLLFSLTVLVLPDPLAVWLGLTDIVVTYRGWISLVLILSIAGLIAHVVMAGGRAIRARLDLHTRAREEEVATEELIEARQQVINRAIDRLDSLSDDELDWVAFAVKNRQQTITTHAAHAVASSLVDKGFLKIGSGGTPLNYPYHFYDDIWDVLVENLDQILAIQNRRKP